MATLLACLGPEPQLAACILDHTVNIFLYLPYARVAYGIMCIDLVEGRYLPVTDFTGRQIRNFLKSRSQIIFTGRMLIEVIYRTTLDLVMSLNEFLIESRPDLVHGISDND